MSLTLTPCCAQVTAEISRKIHEVAGRDPLSDITVQDAELLASYRRFCCVHMPHAIPKLLDAVKWESRRDVAQVRGVTWDSGGGGVRSVLRVICSLVGIFSRRCAMDFEQGTGINVYYCGLKPFRRTRNYYR